jgi:uncharacterized protein (DUF1778 family)
MAKLAKKPSRVVQNATPRDRGVHESTSRLEARVPAELYELMKHAAELRGMSLTSYVIESVGRQAQKDIEEMTILRLALPDQLRFAAALLDPPAPNERLKRAFALRDELIARE